MLQAHPKLDLLLDPEDTVGSGKFLPRLEDPEHCNALTSDLKELRVLLEYSENGQVRALVAHILGGEKSRLSRDLVQLMEK